MSWKHDLKLTDLPPDEQLEITCKTCGKLRYESADVLIFSTSRHYTVAELEQQLKCTRRGCGGAVRIARNHGGKMEGFVGGMA